MARRCRYIEISYVLAERRMNAVICSPLTFVGVSRRNEVAETTDSAPDTSLPRKTAVPSGERRSQHYNSGHRQFSAPAQARQIRLLVFDVDGFLSRNGVLPVAIIAAAARLAEARIALTLISTRPPADLLAIAHAIGVTVPLAAFNGATIVDPNGTILSTHPLSADASRAVIALFEAAKITIRVYAHGTWFTNNPVNLRNRRERGISSREPVVVHHFDMLHGRIDKIVAMSDDVAYVGQLESMVKEKLGARVATSRPLDCYCDVVHPIANKAAGIMMLAARIGIPLAETTVVGRSRADIPMMVRANCSVALNRPPKQVVAAATWVLAADRKGDIAQALDELLRTSGREMPRARRK